MRTTTGPPPTGGGPRRGPATGQPQLRPPSGLFAPHAGRCRVDLPWLHGPKPVGRRGGVGITKKRPSKQPRRGVIAALRAMKERMQRAPRAPDGRCLGHRAARGRQPAGACRSSASPGPVGRYTTTGLSFLFGRGCGSFPSCSVVVGIAIVGTMPRADYGRLTARSRHDLHRLARPVPPHDGHPVAVGVDGPGHRARRGGRVAARVPAAAAHRLLGSVPRAVRRCRRGRAGRDEGHHP